jgi:hypothetical protein
MVCQPVWSGRFSLVRRRCQLVRTGIGTARSTFSARTVATGVKIVAADARYVEQEAESSARLDAIGSRVG